MQSGTDLISGELLAIDTNFLMRFYAESEGHAGLFGEAVSFNNVGVLEFSGVVEKRGGNPFFRSASLADLETQLFSLGDEIDTVILHIDSPGGYVTGLPEAYRVLADLPENINTIAYTDTCMCSAAYYIASACDQIVAAPSATVGSVGVYGVIADHSRAAAEQGVEVHVIRSGDLKGAGIPGKEVTAEEIAHEQSIVDHLFADFRSKVEYARPGVDEEVFRGAAYPGDQALRMGLIDASADRIEEVIAALI